MTNPEVKIEVRCRRLHYWAAVILNWLHCYKLAYKFTKAGTQYRVLPNKIMPSKGWQNASKVLAVAVLLAAPAEAGPFSRSRSYNNSPPPQRPPVYNSRITGNVTDLPQEPEFYTVAVFPTNYGTNPDSQELLRALGTDPTLVELRRHSCLQTYVVTDPDFAHRFKPETSCRKVLEGGTALMIVDRTGGLVWWLQGGSYRQYAADIERNGVLEEVQLSGMGILRRPRPRVCTPETCPPNGPSITPNPTQPDDGGPIRPIPSPIDIVETPEDTVPPAAPPVTPTTPDQSEQIKQLQAQVAALKQQVTVNINTATDAKTTALKPFYIRVVDPRGKYSTEWKSVRLGQEVDLILEPIGP
jgi:hypothetical protein